MMRCVFKRLVLCPIVFMISASGRGDLTPEQAVEAESWEGLYDIKLECVNPNPVCVEVTKRVDFGAASLSEKGLYFLMSKRAEAWPFYGFVLTESRGAGQFAGSTQDRTLLIEALLERKGDGGSISGWVRDARVTEDIKVTGTPIKTEGKRQLSRLYARRIAGDPLSMSEVVGKYSGKAAEAGVFVLKESALSPEPKFLGATFIRARDSKTDHFSEIKMDPVRGLVTFIQFENRLPLRKWVLAFRREDIDFNPWFLGVGIDLRTPSAYDVDLEKN